MKLEFVKKFSGKEYHRVVLIFLFVFIFAGFTLISPYIISILVDNIIDGKPIEAGWIMQIVDFLGGVQGIKDNLWISFAIIVIVNFIAGYANYLNGINCATLSETFAKNLRNKVYEHLQHLPFSYHTQKDSGDLIQRSTSDVDQIRRFLQGQLSELMYAVFMVLIASIILLTINVKLTIISLVVMPFIIIASFIFFSKSKKIFLECDEAEADLSATLQEHLNAVRVVKAFHRERFEIEKFEKVNDIFCRKIYDLMYALTIFWSSTDLLCYLQILAVIVVGIFMAIAGDITAGEFFVFTTYSTMVVWPMRQLGRTIADLGKVSVSITRIQEILDEEKEALYNEQTLDLVGKIVFDHVSFKYDDGEDFVLRDISFEINPNEKIAIMGATGSGKSSLAYLLNRIYDVSEGSILIDGVDIKDIQKAWLRNHVQIVLQEPFLFSKTIYENIHLADYSASRNEVYDASRVASIHDVINDFESGYDTEVGEKGVTLSGGQKQRLSIARTIMKKADVVVFDDSLSALDSQTDANIQQALHEVGNQMTLIMITHRVNTAMDADKIIVLERGRIKQMGNHESLLKEDGIYKHIYEIQHEGGEELE